MAAAIADGFDLGRMALDAGEARRVDLAVRIGALAFADERYVVGPDPVAVRLDTARTTGRGWSLRLRLEARIAGPCMRCLRDAAPTFSVDAREIHQPGEGDELESPYVGDRGILDLRAWARDSLSLSVPAQVLCRVQCAGLCPTCGTDLETAGPDHGHEPEPDPRWAKLRELHLE